jgi:hypothetical protein
VSEGGLSRQRHSKSVVVRFWERCGLRAILHLTPLAAATLRVRVAQRQTIADEFP